MFDDVEVGDIVVRRLAGSLPMAMKVTGLDETPIYCGRWKFLKSTGGEVDDERGWDGINTGSFLIPPDSRRYPKDRQLGEAFHSHAQEEQYARTFLVLHLFSARKV
jgi:hypothetical protein